MAGTSGSRTTVRDEAPCRPEGRCGHARAATETGAPRPSRAALAIGAGRGAGGAGDGLDDPRLQLDRALQQAAVLGREVAQPAGDLLRGLALLALRARAAAARGLVGGGEGVGGLALRRGQRRRGREVEPRQRFVLRPQRLGQALRRDHQWLHHGVSPFRGLSEFPCLGPYDAVEGAIVCRDANSP
jgi:hypothetical protein